MSTLWDDPRVAQLEASLERCMRDHGDVCTEMHQFRRERDKLQSRLTTLLEAAEAHLNPARVPVEQWTQTQRDLSAAIEKAREGL